MKSRFFKKSQNLSHSTSCDSKLAGQHDTNNSIDKPNGLKPIGESPSTDARRLALLQSSLCQLSPISSQGSSTHGMIGCANELFEGAINRWEIPKEMKLLAGKRQPSGGQQFDEGCSSALVKYAENKLSPTSTCLLPTSSSGSGNQVADLVFTLAQQLSGKDAEIVRLRAHQRKAEYRMERICRDFERDLERKNEELETAREQLSRMRKKVKAYETEIEIANRVNKRMSREEPNSDAEKEKLLAENAQLKAKLAQEVRYHNEKEDEWERERKELKQSVQSLNGTMEELESELRQREAKEREMHLELERAQIERQISRMGLFNEEATEKTALLDFPSPKTDSSIDGQCLSSTASSSGIGTLIPKELLDQKDLDRALSKAKSRLKECRAKIGQLVRTAEKVQRGEKLSREDLFGTNLTSCNDSDGMQGISIAAAVEEHLKQILAIRKDLELLHDKFTILYAKGAIGH